MLSVKRNAFLANEKGTIIRQDIDLDDIEITILIIAKSPPKISQAANFLSRRGWPTTVMNNLSSAIEFATDRQPDFVLISINHPNPALKKFADLLTNTFGCTCVAFAENLDNSSQARLQKSTMLFKIQGQASGPNLHRSVRRLLADKLNIQLDERGQPQERNHVIERNVNFRGGGTANDGQTIIQKSEPGVTSGKGPTFIKGEEAQNYGGEGDYENESVSTGKYTMSKKNRRSLKELSENPLENPGDVVLGEAGRLAAELKRSLFGDTPEAEVTSSEGEEAESPEMNAAEITEESFEGYDPAKNKEKDGVGVHSTRPQTGNQTSALSAASQAPNPSHSNSQSHSAKGALNQGNTDAINEAKKHKTVAAVGMFSLVERAVQMALAEVCRPAHGLPTPIDMIRQVGVFPVDSPSLPGYLVLAWPTEQKESNQGFFKQAQLIINLKFQEMGVQGHLEPGFFVSLPEVEFASWALDSASFSFSTAHGAEEVGVAFFSTQKPIPKPRQIADRSMFSINLENISTEEPVNFKLYLHMQQNKKFFLYLRNGRVLQPEQKERLEGRKVTDLYMKSVDLENLRMFLAICHLRQKIKKAG